MVNFNFTLDDVDAENIVGVIQSEITNSRGIEQQRLLVKINKCKDDELKTQYTLTKYGLLSYADYLEELLEKITASSTRV